MNISIITLFPDLYNSFLQTSLIGRAIQRGLVDIKLKNLFDYSQAKSRIDAPVFGHNAGMLIKPNVIENAILEQDKSYNKSYKIFFSPQGKKLDQNVLKQILLKPNIMLLPARYEGMDNRVEEVYSDLTISIGDYVLMGGDLPAMVLLEGLIRLLPDVVSSQESIDQESFAGPFLDHPSYTVPVVWNGLQVPDVIRSGHHKEILNWQREFSIKKTIYNNFDWLKSHVKNIDDIKDTAKYLPSHYVVLMHDQVIVDDERIGASSVTSLDIHDIARSACTYGLKKYFIVSPLPDQQKIVNKLLNFWLDSVGINYNFSRHQAMKNVILCSSIEEVIARIEEFEDNNTPILIATTAKIKNLADNRSNVINYYDQETVWANKKPVLFVLGTARGLSNGILDRCDYLLEPVRGFSDYNHLSVRSAAAVIFDRWFGINSKI